MDERFYISKISGEIATFDAGEANHISKVRRKSVGDEIKGFNGDGYDYTLKIELPKFNLSKKIKRCMSQISQFILQCSKMMHSPLQ